MKKNLIFFLGLFFIACSGNNKKDNELDSELLEGQWNGEYVEVRGENPEENEKKRPSKKSQGSEYLNLGKVTFEIGGNSNKISFFNKRKNDVVINENKISIRVNDANDQSFKIILFKDKIFENPRGKYAVVVENKKCKNGVSIVYTNNLTDKNTTYEFIKGSAEVNQLKFDSGEFVFTVKGTAKNIDSEEITPIELDIDMRFETVVSAFNPKIQ